MLILRESVLLPTDFFEEANIIFAGRKNAASQASVAGQSQILYVDTSATDLDDHATKF